MKLPSGNRAVAVGLLVVGISGWTLAQPPGFGPGGREGRMRMPPFPVMQALDADGDGELSPREIENASAALRTLDKDKNGRLSAEELRPNFERFGGPGGPGGPGGGFNPEALVNQMLAFDKNKDGKLAKEELPERLQGLLDRADTNKDGFIDRDELTTLARQRAGGGPGRGPGGGFRGREGAEPPGPGEGPGGRERRRPDADESAPRSAPRANRIS
ncbi:MAG: EF-hand domain-containing protein [Isosphaeraceae bacterium]